MLDISGNKVTDFRKNTLNTSDFFDIDELQQIQNRFSEFSGLASIITSIDGNPITKPSNFSSYCKIIRKNDNQVRWVRDNGTVVRNSANEIEMTIGTIQDITEIKKCRRNCPAKRTALQNGTRKCSGCVLQGW